MPIKVSAASSPEDKSGPASNSMARYQVPTARHQHVPKSVPVIILGDSIKNHNCAINSSSNKTNFHQDRNYERLSDSFSSSTDSKYDFSISSGIESAESYSSSFDSACSTTCSNLIERKSDKTSFVPAGIQSQSSEACSLATLTNDDFDHDLDTQVHAIDVEHIPDDSSSMKDDDSVTNGESPDSSITGVADANHELEHGPECETIEERQSQRSLVSARRPDADSISTATRGTSSVAAENLGPTHLQQVGNLRINALRESLQYSTHHKVKNPIISSMTSISTHELLLIDKENKAVILLNKTNNTCTWSVLFSCDSILLAGLLTANTLTQEGKPYLALIALSAQSETWKSNKHFILFYILNPSLSNSHSGNKLTYSDPRSTRICRELKCNSQTNACIVELPKGTIVCSVTGADNLYVIPKLPFNPEAHITFGHRYLSSSFCSMVLTTGVLPHLVVALKGKNVLIYHVVPGDANEPDKLEGPISIANTAPLFGSIPVHLLFFVYTPKIPNHVLYQPNQISLTSQKLHIVMALDDQGHMSAFSVTEAGEVIPKQIEFVNSLQDGMNLFEDVNSWTMIDIGELGAFHSKVEAIHFYKLS